MSDRDIQTSIAQTQELSTAGPSFEAVVRALGAAIRAVKKAQLPSPPGRSPRPSGVRASGRAAPPAGEALRQQEEPA